jgi:hypothetical protein
MALLDFSIVKFFPIRVLFVPQRTDFQLKASLVSKFQVLNVYTSGNTHGNQRIGHTMKKFNFLALFVLAGCTHQFALMPRDGGHSGSGEANESGKEININLNGRAYIGTYVYDGGKFITTHASGITQGYAGGLNATASYTGVASTFVPGSGNGKIVATSDGDTLRCDFQYSNGSGIGICNDKAGKQYDLLILNW